ncbi:DNA-3-methyladenine glycosylase [Haloferula luteola]|uniref:Putative 3-methyladenine DNA glycosylase n=1 Tax=Haloferula luteola TaxID=595692 RepID=A0A840UXB0_9BACT|nr:DNA-3-methyladenine glycosylase [Haloferula luteola]
MSALREKFFERSPVDCARDLIGAEFRWDGCSGKIVETEAYSDRGDPACHTFFRPSARTFVENHPPGAAYVYLNYGVHWLFNILTRDADGSGFVLLRALEPRTGLEMMRQRRGGRRDRELCSGPGRLCQALGIEGSAHGSCFLSEEKRGLAVSSENIRVVAGPRIGIRRAVDLPWRFGEAGSAYLSRAF